MSVRVRWLTGLAAVLAVLLALEWSLPNQAAPAASVPLARFQAAGRAATLPTRKASTWSAAILARPVFSISRRPPRVAAAGPASAGPGQARLAGIMITRYGRRAIFAPDGGGRALVVAEGGSINQTTIRSILPDRVVLAGGVVLRPVYDRNRPATTTTPFQPTAPFNPGFPNFANPAGQFNNPNILTPGVAPPPFQPQPFQPSGVPALQTNGEESTQPFPPPQPFRGGLIPQRRE